VLRLFLPLFVSFGGGVYGFVKNGAESKDASFSYNILYILNEKSSHNVSNYQP
jgi:hypothetical protein